MDYRYSDLVEATARLMENELVPGGGGLMGMIPGMPAMPDRSGMVPDVPAMPDGSGMIPGVPAMPDPPAMPDRSGMIPDVPQMPDESGLVPGGMIPQRPEVPDLGQDRLDDGVAAAEEKRKNAEAARTDWLRREFGDDLGLEGDGTDVGDGYADWKETAEEPEREQPALAADEEDATAVLLVCRNGWNTVDTRAVGGHWFSRMTTPHARETSYTDLPAGQLNVYFIDVSNIWKPKATRRT